MQKASFQLLFVIAGFFLCGLLYFLLLPLHWPAFVILALSLIIMIPAYRYLAPRLQLAETLAWRKADITLGLVLLGGLFLITRAVLLTGVHPGNMDSVQMWNYYARFLTLPEWRLLFTDPTGYPPSHPLGLPAGIAFLWQLLRTDHPPVPIAISYLFVLLTPLILYLETVRINVVLAVLALLLFATDHAFTGKALAQCADAPMGCVLLGLIIATEHFKRTGQRAYLGLAGILLGCCLWLKNEGLIYAGYYLLCYARTFFSRKQAPLVFAGLLPFITALVVYKGFYAVPNKVVQHFNVGTLRHFTDRHYYGVILQHFSATMQKYFYPWQIGLALYLLIALIIRQKPAWNVLVVVGMMGLVLGFYFLTPGDLLWQLDTSLERVLSQLMPALAYTLILGFTNIKTGQAPGPSMTAPGKQ